MPISGTNNHLAIAVMPGDGIGPEVTAPTLKLIDQALARVGDGVRLNYEELDAGANCYRRTGTPMSEEVFEKASAADAILFGAMGLPDVRRPDGIEIAPQLDLRFRLELFAGVRPVRSIPGAPSPLADPRAQKLDFVLIRESTEGLFTSRGKGEVTSDYARETWEITRIGSERVFDFAFKLARRRKAKGSPGRVACVDKSGVFRAFAFFRQIYFERAAAFPDIKADAYNVDATALDLIRRPWIFDVLVHREPVRRHPLRCRRSVDGRDGHGAFGRYRLETRHVSAVPWHGAGHRRDRKGEPDGHDFVGCDDAGLAWGNEGAAWMLRRRHAVEPRCGGGLRTG